MKNTKRFLSALLCIVLLCSLAACGTGTAVGKTVRCLLTEEPATLDPQFAKGEDAATVIAALFEGLTRLDAEGNAQPAAAAGWSANSDATQFVFTLRDEAVWNKPAGGDGSTGEPELVTAQDFVFAWRRALSPAAQSPSYAALYCIRGARAVHEGTQPAASLGVSAPDDHTLVVELDYPCPDFPARAAQPVFMPCKESFFEGCSGRYGLEPETLLGNGPFRMNSGSWDHGVSLSVTRAQDYRGTIEILPAALHFSIGKAVDPEGGTKGADPVTALSDGLLDVAPLSPADLTRAKSLGLSVTSFEDQGWGLLLNSEGAFQSEGLRSALLSAINRSTLLTALPEGARELSGVLPSAVRYQGGYYRDFAGDCVLPAENRELARSLYQEAGGGSYTLLCCEENKALGNLLLAKWKDTFDAYFNLKVVSRETLLSRTASGQYELALYPVAPSTADALPILNALSRNHNRTGVIGDGVFDGLLSAAHNEGSVSALLEAENRLISAGLYYPLYSQPRVWASSKAVSGAILRPFAGGADLCFTAKYT